MNSLTLLKAMNGIDERFIAEAVPEKKRGKLFAFVKAAAAVAACICLVAGGVYAYRYFQPQTPSELPMLSAETIDFGGMGFEGNDSLTLSHSEDINPWNENSSISTLPVYKNLCYTYDGQKKSYYSEKDFMKKAEEIAALFGEKITSTEVYADDSNEKIVYNLIAQTENYQFSVSGGAVSVEFKNTQGRTDISVLKEKYPFLFEDKDVIGKYQSFSIDGEPFSPQYRKYTKGETAAEDIVNFNLKDIEFCYSENGEIYFAWIHDYTACSEKLGDYPVISVDEAKEKLLSGQYLTSVDAGYYISSGKVEERFIEKVDLIYYTNNNQQLFMPYYRFYVLLDLFPFETGNLPEDYEHYGYFYVPAVEEQYFENYELFDGTFQ